MKSVTITLCFILILFTVISVFLPIEAMAYDPRNDLASNIDLKATRLMLKKSLSEDKTAKEGGNSREMSVPVGDGLSTYIDCSPPPSRQDPGREAKKDFRAVFGFHINLK